MTDFDDKYIPEFSKDKKKLKIRTIDEDLEIFEKAFSVDLTNLTGLVQIPGLAKKGVKIPIYKAKKFRCKYLSRGSRSGVRIILAYIAEKDKAVYIEIYKKGNRSNHDENRILRHFKNKTIL